MTSQWHGGKGSGSRPLSITQEEYDNRWDFIFGKDKAKVKEEFVEEDDDLEEDNQDESETDTEQE